jgi:tRNA dimethylallyltransferase
MTLNLAPIYLLAGPTASGKSEHAFNWALKHQGIILNADSMQHYEDVQSLTACPSEAEKALVPHHLYGHLPPNILWSTGDWIRAAKPYIEQALGGGAPLCIVGGTGLYFLSLIRGLAHIPDISDEVRQNTRRVFTELGEATFRQRLALIDPTSEARISPHDQQRLTRALEVWAETGKSLSDWHAHTEPLLLPKTYRLDILNLRRVDLYARCDKRLEEMMDKGALIEVKALMDKGLRPDWPIMRVLGLRALVQHLSGELTLSEALTQAQQQTRNYAKRQTTFFGNQFLK